MPPSHPPNSLAVQPASLRLDQITTLGWLRSRRTSAPMFATYLDEFAKSRFSSITTTPAEEATWTCLGHVSELSQSCLGRV